MLSCLMRLLAGNCKGQQGAETGRPHVGRKVIGQVGFVLC